MVFERLNLGFSPAEICWFSAGFFIFCVRKIRILLQPAETWRVFSSVLGAGAFPEPCSCSELSCAGDLLQRAGSKVCFGAGEWKGNFPTRNQKSTLILSWPVVYFSIAKINKAIFMLPLHKPILQLKCWTRLNFVYKANCLLIRLPLMKPKRSISAKIQPSCGVEFFLFCF